jgi:hypothetical protein
MCNKHGWSESKNARKGTGLPIVDCRLPITAGEARREKRRSQKSENLQSENLQSTI